MVKKECIAVRHVQMFLLFWVICSSTMLRNCLSVAILPMIKKSSSADVQIYDWSKKTQGIILSSSMWGETITLALGGILCNKFGAKNIIFISLLISGIFLMLIPLFARMGDWIGVCICRVIQGMFLSMINPCVHALLGKWTPLSERLRSGIFVYSGTFIIAIIFAPVVTFIAKSDLGWPYIFYSFGLLSFFYSVLWLWTAIESPNEDKSLSFEEKKLFIQSPSNSEPEETKIPWKSIFTSKPYIALMLTQIGCDWSYAVIAGEMPSYFRLALNVELEETGFLTSLANIVCVVSMVTASILADFIHNKEYISSTKSRKLFNTIGSWGAAVCLCMIAIFPKLQDNLAICFIIAASALDAVSCSGFYLNHIDLSPKYASVLFGISSNVAKLFNMMSPIVTGVIVSDPSDLSKWRIVFFIATMMYFFANLVFLIFGSGKKQIWDGSDQDVKGELTIESKMTSNYMCGERVL